MPEIGHQVPHRVKPARQKRAGSSLSGVIEQRQKVGLNDYSCLTISTEISTAGIVPLFSSQWVVFLSSGQPTPGP